MIYGLDVSLTNTGIAWEHGGGHLARVKSKGTKAATWGERQQRIWSVQHQIVAKLRDPSLVVIEAPAYATYTGSVHDRSHLWWLVVDSLAQRGVPVAFCPPTNRAKFATGKGNAGKTAVVEQVARRLGHLWTDIGGDDNAADAAALCAMGHEWAGAPLVEMPQTHLDAMRGVVWPEVAA